MSVLLAQPCYTVLYLGSRLFDMERPWITLHLSQPRATSPSLMPFAKETSHSGIITLDFRCVQSGASRQRTIKTLCFCPHELKASSSNNLSSELYRQP